MKKALFLYKGGEHELQAGGRYAKDILRVGRWVHPRTKQEVNITRERLLNIAENSEKFRLNQDRKRIHYPDGHTDAVDKNLGWWDRPFAVLGDRLYGFVKPSNSEIAKKMEDGSIGAVSAMIEFGRADSTGQKYDEVITHVCATNSPVITGQQDWVKLSADSMEQDLYIPLELAGTSPEGNSNSTEGQMDLKKLAKALGLPESTPADKIMEAAEKAGQAASKLSAVDEAQTKLSAELKAKGFELKDGKLVALSSSGDQLDTAVKPGDSEEVKKLKLKIANQDAQLSTQDQRLNTLDEAGKKTFVEKAQAMALEHVKEGRIPPALQATVAEVLSIQGEVQALSLSNGKSVEKALNLVDRLQSVFKSLPSIKGAALSQNGGAAGEDKESQERRAKAREVAARNGGKKVQEPAGTK